jgi:hypothetical protein
MVNSQQRTFKSTYLSYGYPFPLGMKAYFSTTVVPSAWEAEIVGLRFEANPNLPKGQMHW